MNCKSKERIKRLISWIAIPITFLISTLLIITHSLLSGYTLRGIWKELDEAILLIMAVFAFLLIIVGIVYTVLSLIVKAGKKKIIFSIALLLIGVFILAIVAYLVVPFFVIIAKMDSGPIKTVDIKKTIPETDIEITITAGYSAFPDPDTRFEGFYYDCYGTKHIIDRWYVEGDGTYITENDINIVNNGDGTFSINSIWKESDIKAYPIPQNQQ